MNRSKMREKLVMKDVGTQDLSQFDELLRYVFQITQEDIDNSGYEKGELLKVKRPILKQADVIGWYNDKQLISQLAIYPAEVNLFGTVVKMGGVTGVGTYPEFANMGLMQDLIIKSLERMRANKQWISYLYPYSIPFYRKKGWEIISDRMTFEIQEAQLINLETTQGFIKREAIDHKDIKDVYDQFARDNHGALIRNDFYWEEYWRWENETERIAGIYYNEKQEAEGYMVYWVAEEIMHIKEIVTLNNEAWRGIWNFISAHISMVEKVKGFQYINDPLSFKIVDGDIKESIETYYMARIIDVEAFLKIYPFKEIGKPFHIVLKDSIAPWNNRVFGVCWQNEEIQISEEPIGQKLETDIQTLTTMLLSYKRPMYLFKNDRIVCERTLIKQLEAMIYDEKPYFSDYF